MNTAVRPGPPSDPFSIPLVEAMTTQRAIRRLKPDPVDDALLLRLVELALRAPPGGNARGWEFIVDWRDAFQTAISKTTGCVKVAFTFAEAAAA